MMPASRAAPTTSPLMELPAIGEKVPVYTDRVRLTREVAIGQNASASGSILTIRGALRYQACDDRQCFIPVTVPLEWNLKVEQHDRERAPAALQRKPAQ